MRHLPFFLCVTGLLLGVVTGPVSFGQDDAAAVYIEDSPDADELVKQAEHLRGQKRLTEAAAAFQKVADEYTHKLMQVRGNVYADAVVWVRQRVAGDRELLDAYRQSHEPEARRALELAGLDVVKLDAVAQRYMLCESGLEASLRAAALLLEEARPIDAGNVLDDVATHPDLDAHRSRWHLLQAAVGVYSNENSRVDAHLKALRDLKDVDAQRQVEQWRTQLAVDVSKRPLDALGTLPQASYPEPLGKPLYSTEVRSSGEPATPRRDPNRSRREMGNVVIPVIDNDVVYVNTGSVIRALDRSSLSDVWADGYSLGITDGSTIHFSNDQPQYDHRGVLVDGDVLVAVMGEGALMHRRSYSNEPETALVGLNRRTGGRLWRIETKDIDAQLDAAFMHGIPVGGGGRAYVTLRRTQNSGFHDGYIIAVDSRTGELLWRRHLSSTNVRLASRGLTQALFHRGMIYVTDNLGGIACIDGRTGTMRWLTKMTRLRLNAVGRSLAAGEPWTINPPVLVEAGLVVPPFLPGTSALLLDPRTGEEKKVLNDPPFTQAAYLADANGDVLSLAGTVRLFDGKTLEEKWVHDLGVGIEPQGRAAVTEDRVLIPTSTRLIVLELATGKRLSDSKLEKSGNVLAVDGQVLVASGNVLRNYMTWPVVYANLSERMKKAEDDPQPGLALARAALASNRPAEAIEGVDHVVAVLRLRALTRPAELRPETDELHAEAFRQLLRLADAEMVEDRRLRGQIFDRIAGATATPADEVQYHLAFAGYLEESDWPEAEQDARRREAVRHYQTVLENGTLASQLYRSNGTWQQAGLEARQRLAGLIERHGRNVYSEYHERAAARLDIMLQSSQTTAAALIELARQYPLADTAPTALTRAGDKLAAAGKPIDAITQWRRAMREKPEGPLRRHIIGRLVEQYVRVGKVRRARQWLQRAAREDIQPLRDGQPVSAKAWLADLGATPAGSFLSPLSAELGEPTSFPGRLLTPLRQPREQWPNDRIITLTAEGVQYRTLPDLAVRWTARLDLASRLLWLSDGVVLFFNEHDNKLIALNPADGKRLWDDVSAVELFRQFAVRPADGEADEMDDLIRRLQDLERMNDVRRRFPDDVAGRVFDDRVHFQQGPVGVPVSINGQVDDGAPLFTDSALHVAVNDAVICLTDPAGRAVGIDMDTGQMIWRFVCPFDRLTRVAMSGEAVSFAGVVRPSTAGEAWLAVTLDALTGETLMQLELPGRPAWLGLTDAGALMYITDPADRNAKARFSLHQLPDGGLQWRADLAPGEVKAAMQVGDGVFALLGEEDVTVLIDPINKAVRHIVTPYSSRSTENESLDVSSVGDRWHLLSEDWSMALDEESKLLWRDGIDTVAGPRIMQLPCREHMVVITRPIPEGADRNRLGLLELQRFPDEPGRAHLYQVYVVDREGGAIQSVHDLPVTGGQLQAGRAVILNHRLIVSTGGRVIVIPDGPAPPP